MTKIGLRLTNNDLLELAKEFDLDINLIKTVKDVESNSKGFIDDTNNPTIRFENHWFDKLTKGKFKKDYPEITVHYKIKNYNKKGLEEVKRFDKAFELAETEACLSTSWGLFQIMGFNYNLCGYDDVYEFIKDMFISEKNQLRAFLNYITETGIIKYLKDLKFETFAFAYNGKDYKSNNYDVKLTTIYNNYKNGTIR